MNPQLTKFAECLSESHAREIKLARCLAESLKRIQTLETKGGKQAAVIQTQFHEAVQSVAEKLAQHTTETAGALSQRIDGIAQALPVELSAVRSEMETVREMAAKTTGAANIAAAEIAQRMTEIEATFPAQLAALKTEFAKPEAQAAAPQSFNPRGAYEPGEKYKPFDYVSSNGSSYIALVENPTQPPSKKSKQWMLVAARGAGGGGVTGLGTAAYRDVGQAPGNVLEFGVDATISIGGAGTGPGQIRLHDGANDNFMLLQAIDAGLQITAGDGSRVRIKPPTDGDRLLTIQDLDGTLALLSQVGDRYLTSSTTSNTVSNGAKTFTVGTGLAYTPTQDITIVFDAAHHMHASVTSYNSATGVLVVDVNSHTGSGTYAVWTVNVGGIGAGAIPSGGTTGQVLAKVSSTNYDDAWVTPTVAVGGVTGLGTGVATALAVNVGTAGAPVVLNGAGGTPSSITLTNATDYPAATTTTAGITAVGIASPQSPVSTNAARISQVTAFGRLFNSVLFTDFLGGGYSGSPGTASDGYVFGTGVSGTGSAIAKLNVQVSGHAGILLLTTGTTTTGYSAYDTFGSSNTFRYDDGETVFEAVVRLPVLSTVTDEYSFAIGGSPQNNGVLGNDGAMFYYKRVSYGANWQAVTRSSASQTTTDTAVAVAANTWVRLTLIVNAAGTSVTYYINGTLVATITTNIPAGGAGREGCLLLKSAGTTSVTANVDYHFVGKTFTTSR